MKKYLITDGFELTLHTRIARYLVTGGHALNIGLLVFAKHIKSLYQASKLDDPYAQWCILKCYEMIADARTKIKSLEVILAEQMQGVRGVKMSLFENPEPFKAPLKFAYQAGYQCAELIESIDYVSRQLLTLHKFGLRPTEKITPKDLIGYIKPVLDFPAKWESTGVTRQDIAEHTEKAERAKSLFGELPQEVLNKEIEFSYLPELRG